MTVTLFRTLFDKHPKYYDVQVVLETFRKGPTSLPLIQQVRSTANKEQRDELKKKLPVVLFGGEFNERKETALKKYSNLVVLDFDDCNIKLKRDELVLLPFVYAVWLSPSGDGLKALVKVSSENHRGHFKALLKEISGVDVSGSDPSRACFVSFDPNLYLNESAQVYTKFVEQAYNDEQKLEKLKKWLENKGEAFVSGNRNNFLAKLCGAANRFGVSRTFVEEVFKRDYCSSDFAEREALMVVNSMYKKVEEHGIASFDDAFSEAEVKDILSGELVATDIILVGDIREDLNKDYEEGSKPGEETYFPILDEHFRWMRGDFTVLTGIPNGGKSGILQQLLTFKAVFRKEKSVFLSMENWPPVYFYKEIARTLIGKPLEKDAPNRMTKKEYNRALDFIHEYFIFLYPSKDDPTPEWTLARFAEVVIKYNVDNLIIDPHNSQDHDQRSSYGRDDKYIGSMINKYKKFALQNNKYFIDVAHPKNIGKNEDGLYKEPTADEITGGHIWAAKADNVLVFHRPMMPLDYTDSTCTLRSVKIKKRQTCGIPGLTSFQYRLDTGRYYEEGYNPLEGIEL